MERAPTDYKQQTKNAHEHSDNTRRNDDEEELAGKLAAIADAPNISAGTGPEPFCQIDPPKLRIVVYRTNLSRLKH